MVKTSFMESKSLGKPNSMWIWLVIALIFDFVALPILLFGDALCGIAAIGSAGVLALPCWALPIILVIVWYAYKYWFVPSIKFSGSMILFLFTIFTIIGESVPVLRSLPMFTVTTLLAIMLHKSK